MAENDQEKTEAPTPKRREEARTEGRIPRSTELNTAVLLLGSALVLKTVGSTLGGTMVAVFASGIVLAGAGPLDAQGAVALLRDTGWRVLGALAAFLLAMGGLALAVGAAQARGVVSGKPLAPKWERVSPLANAKRMLGVQPWAEMVKSLVKLLLVALVVHASLSDAWPEILVLVQQSPLGLLEVVRRHALGLLQTAGFAYLGLAAADYGFQLWQHEKELKMSRDEVKQEMKQSEGDPLLKSRMRSVARALARRQMLRDVPQADVVVTNPTHVAVALRYDPGVAPAPVVVAMGERKVAERIKAIAREAGVPCVENRPLARALLASARVGTVIPAELYVAVAEVLAFVIRQRQARRGWAGSATA